MPFKSEAQRRYLWANEPEIARDWTDTYGSKIQKAQGGRIGFALGSGELNRMAMEMFGKELRLLSEDEMDQLRYEWEMKKGMIEENYGDPYAKGGRIGYYTGGQSIPSEYTVEDARKSAMQDKLGGITDIMKKADLYRQGDIGQMYMADGGIMRVPLAYGMSPGEAQARGLGAESHGRDFGGKDETAHRNIHAGMTSPSMTTAGTLSDPREKQDYFTQTYSGQPNFLGFGGGYRNLRTPNDARSGYQSRLNPMGLMSLLGGFIKKSSPFTFAATGINALRNKFGPAWTDWTDANNLAEFLRRRKTGETITNPAVRGEYVLPDRNIEEINIDEFQPYGVDVENLYEEFPTENEDRGEEEAMMQNIKDYYIV